MSNIPSQEIINRIFEAIDLLTEEKEIPGIVYIIEKHKLPKSKMYAMKSGQNPAEGHAYKTVPFDALYILAKEYDISLEWLIFGIGKPKKKYKLDA